MLFALPSERPFLQADRMSFPTDWTDNMDNSNCTQIRSIVQPCASCRDREETTMHGSREVRQDRSVAVRVRHERWASPAARLRSHARLSITLEGTYNEARHMMDVAANQVAAFDCRCVGTVRD
jgi:hypothetical protein